MPDIYKLQYGGNTITYPGWNGYVGWEKPEPNTRVIYDTSTAQASTIRLLLNRVIFAVLPTTADNTQFAIVTNGLKTPSGGAALFWVTDYSISAEGILTVKGYKGQYNNTSCSSSTGWPSYPSNRLYYNTGTKVYNVTNEIHKMGLAVPSDAIAVLVAYNWGANDSANCSVLTVNTNKIYTSVKDATFAVIQGSSYVSTIYNMGANTQSTLTYAAANVLYPFETNKTIVVGSRTSLGL